MVDAVARHRDRAPAIAACVEEPGLIPDVSPDAPPGSSGLTLDGGALRAR
jgi:hypothetical protein